MAPAHLRYSIPTAAIPLGECLTQRHPELARDHALEAGGPALASDDAGHVALGDALPLGEILQESPPRPEQGLAVWGLGVHSGRHSCGNLICQRHITSRKKVPEAQTLPARLRKARQAAGLDRAQVAAKTGLSVSYLSRIEAGERRPRRAALVALANLYAVRVEWLDSGLGEMRPRAAFTEPKGDGGPITWQAALEPSLAGSPLARRTLPRLELGGGEAQDRAWRALPEDKKEEVRRTLRQLAGAAIIIDTSLPRPLAEAVNRELALQALNYIDQVLGVA